MTTYAYNDVIFTRTHIAIPDYTGGFYPGTTDVYDIGTFTCIDFNITGPVDLTFHSYGGGAFIWVDGSQVVQAGPSTPSYPDLYDTLWSLGSGSHHVEVRNPFAGVGSANFAFAGMEATSTGGVPRSSGTVSRGHVTLPPGLTKWRAALANRFASAILWAAIGDSVTQGQGASSQPNAWVDRLQAGLVSYDGAYFTATNDGISGAKVSDIQSGGYVAALDTGTDLVTVELGINDAFNSVTVPTYTTNLGNLIDSIIARCPNASVLVIGAHDITTIAEVTWLTYLAAMVSVASAKGAAYLNMDAIFGDPNTNGLIADGVHPNDAGHKVYADTLFRLLT